MENKQVWKHEQEWKDAWDFAASADNLPYIPEPLIESPNTTILRLAEELANKPGTRWIKLISFGRWEDIRTWIRKEVKLHIIQLLTDGYHGSRFYAEGLVKQCLDLEWQMGLITILRASYQREWNLAHSSIREVNKVSYRTRMRFLDELSDAMLQEYNIFLAEHSIQHSGHDRKPQTCYAARYRSIA